MRKNLGGAKTCMDKMCMETLQWIRSSTSKMEVPKERGLPSLKKGVPQDVIKAEPLKLGPGLIKTDPEKVIAEKEEEVPLNDAAKSLSMGEKKASRTSAGTQTEGKTEAKESDKKSNTSKGTHK